ncbi:MAG: type II secretion system F family protein [Verrucomicrobia bacterium]|nr:type II secretion system F family protein [Verrucomicrobiota bacterium]
MATYAVTLQKWIDPTQRKGRSETKILNVPAPDGRAAMQIAEADGWSVTKAVPVLEKDKKVRQPFPTKPLIVMCTSLASMLDAQIPLPKALEFYLARVTKADQRMALKSVAVAVQRGDDNHKAFAATGRFDSTFIGLVKAGTMASNLSAALRALARRMKTNVEFVGKLRKALLTPCGILAFLWCLLIYSMTVLVPNVEDMLNSMHAPPDGFSAFVFGFSHFYQVVYMPTTIVAFTLLLACGLSRSFRTGVLKLIISRWKLLRQIIMGFRQLTFIGTFEMLLSNNIPIADALDTCARTLKNTPMEKELLLAKEKLALGMNLGEAIRKYTSFDPQLSHMIEVGEKASNLAEQLLLLRDLYEEETTQRIEFFTGLVGLVSKVATVSIIAGIYIGTYLPIVMAGVKMMGA